MVKVDCVHEACRESFDAGASSRDITIARSMLMDDFSFELISKYTGLSFDELKELKNSL